MAAGVVVGTASAAIVGGLLSWIAVRRSLGVIFTGIVTLVFSLAFANLLLGQRELRDPRPVSSSRACLPTSPTITSAATTSSSACSSAS